MKLVYLGSPEAAVPSLNALVDAGHDVLLVVSQPDRKRGRGSALVPSAVKLAALELGLPVTDRIDDVLDAAKRGAELGIVVAYGRLIKPQLLERLAFINLHFSLLPRWRGAAPVERAVLAGDAETGVCLMALEEGLDTGPVYDRVVTAIDENESVSELRNRLVAIGTSMLISRLADPNGLGVAVEQKGDETYAAKLDPAEFRIDWAQSAAQIARLVRLGTAWTTFRGKRLKVLKAAAHAAGIDAEAGKPGTLHEGVVATGDGVCELLMVQPEGKPAMDVRSWLNGARPTTGEELGHE